MTDPVFTPADQCEWPISYASCDGTVCEALTSLPASGQEQVEQMAVELLQRWTGFVFGVCPVTVRPCKQLCYQGQSTYWGGGPALSGGSPWTPVIINGQWYNIGCGLCGDHCSCDLTPSVTLPGPVDSIVSVVIDGQVLPSDAYRVDNYKYLVRLDGDAWPTCQNMSAPSASGIGEPDTWEISYRRGTPVPIGGQVAAGILACELARMLCGDRGCRLPSQWTSITRQGVTIERNFENMEDLRTTGIWLIDSWVQSIIDGPPRPGRVYSPDRPRERVRRTTWPR